MRLIILRFYNVLLLLVLTNSIEGGAFVGKGAHGRPRRLHRTTTSKNFPNQQHPPPRPPNNNDYLHALFSSIHHPENMEELMLLEHPGEREEIQGRSFGVAPVILSAINAVLLLILLITAAATTGANLAADDSGPARQQTTIIQHSKIIPVEQTLVAEDPTWLIDGSAGFFFF